MSDKDISELLNALENESNISIMNMTSSKIKSLKNDMLQKLQLSGKELKVFHKNLRNINIVVI